MKKYAKDFKGKEENFQYVGKRYLVKAEEEELKKRAIMGMVWLTVSTLMMLLALTRNNVGNRGTLLVFLSVALCFPIVYGWMGVWSLFSYMKKEEKQDPGSLAKHWEGEGLWMRRMDYDRCIRRPWRCSLMAALLGGTTLAGDLILLFGQKAFWSPEVIRTEEVLFLAAIAVITLAGAEEAFQNRRLFKKVREETDKIPDKS